MILSKCNVFSGCLNDGYTVQIQVESSPGLKIPSFLKLPLVLEYGLNMPNPIQELHWDENGIHATLSFNREPFDTFVPWESVVGMTGKGLDAVVLWKRQSSNNPPLSNTLSPKPKPTLSIVR